MNVNMAHPENNNPPGVRDVSATPDELNGETVQITREDKDGELIVEHLHPIDATEQLKNEKDAELTDLFNSLSPDVQADMAHSDFP